MKQDDAIDVISVCLFHENKLLTLKRAGTQRNYGGCWEVVSGRVRKGEDLLAAAEREIFEETSLRATVISPTPVDVYLAPYGAQTMRVHVLVARASSNSVTLSVEHANFRWVTLDEFEELCPFERLVKASRRAFK